MTQLLKLRFLMKTFQDFLHIMDFIKMNKSFSESFGSWI